MGTSSDVYEFNQEFPRTNFKSLYNQGYVIMQKND